MVFVTGGTGLVGGYLLRQLLENGHTEATPAVLGRLYRSRTLALLAQNRAREAEEPIRAAVEWARRAEDINFLAAALSTRVTCSTGPPGVRTCRMP